MRLALPIVVFGLMVAGPAHADRADQLFKKGKRLLAEKRYPEACKAFEDSDRLDPGIGAKLNVARCYEEWGRLATAWKWFSDAEKMARDAGDERATKIHELIEELDPNVPRLTVRVPDTADMSGITLQLDGAPFAEAELGVERRIDPGPHRIEYTIDGEKRTKMVPVERGGSSEVTLDVPLESERKPRVTESAHPGRTRRIAGLVTSGVGVAAMGLAGVLTLKARGDYKDALADHCRGATDMCDEDGLRATHDARSRANVATVVTLVGAAAVAGGIVLYLTAPRGAESTEHALYLAPSVGGSGGGVVLGGAF